MSAPEEFPKSNLRQKHVNQLMKTEMCKFFMINKCGKGSQCPFAHTLGEIREKPDLGKTSMCRDFLRTGNCRTPNCTYAHDERELRTTTAFFKTKMCNFAASGRCKHGAACRFAHNPDEIYPMTQQEASDSDAGPPGSRRRGRRAQAPPAPPSQSEQSFSNQGSSSEQNEQSGDVDQGGGRDASSDQSTRDATSASVSTPEGSGDSVQDENPVHGTRRRRQQSAPSRHCTTMMLSNVPTFLTQGAVVSLLEDLTVCMRGAFDFFYCPWNPNQDRNLGYAILNFFSAATAAEFERQWANEPLIPGTHGAKKMKICPASLQGRAANIRHFSGFSLAHHRDPRFRPLVRAAANEALRPMALPDEIVQGPAKRDPSFVAPLTMSPMDVAANVQWRTLGQANGLDYPEQDAHQEHYEEPHQNPYQDAYGDPYPDAYPGPHQEPCPGLRRPGHRDGGARPGFGGPGLAQHALPPSQFCGGMAPQGQHSYMMMPPKQHQPIEEPRSQGVGIMASQCWMMMPPGEGGLSTSSRVAMGGAPPRRGGAGGFQVPMSHFMNQGMYMAPEAAEGLGGQFSD